VTIGTGVLLLWSITMLPGQQTPNPAEPAHKVYVLTGCLEGASAGSAFQLTGASAVGQAPPTRPSTASPKPETSAEFLLQPVSGVGEQGVSRDRLEAHVGARVEVTVRPVEILSSTPPASAARTKPEEPAPQRYTVIKIERRGDSCG
jgi:hypothetical protein